MSSRTLALAVLLGLAVAFGSDRAPAQESAKEEARIYFNAGVQAYKAGQFLAAGQAFIEARKLYPRPELSFSIAQAFRRQFQIDHQPRQLRVAVWYYRQYLAEVKKGGRRLEAVRGLSELTPHLAALGVEDVGPPPEVRFATSLMVTSPTLGAVVSVDDGPPAAAGLSQEVEPGPHVAVVMATGHYPEKRKLEARDGQMVALDVRLREKPALLNVVGTDGAEVAVDGRSSGELPLPRPLELDAGRHFVTVTATGHQPFAHELGLQPGTSTTVDISLPMTDQRVAAYAVLATAAAAVAAGGALAAVALVEQGEAMSIADAYEAGPIEETQRLEHNDAVSRRDDFALASGITTGAGAALTVTGLFLLLLDRPAVSLPPAPDPPPAKPAGDQQPGPDIDLLAGPLLEPGLLGWGLMGWF